MARYVVKSQIRRDGVIYPIGAMFPANVPEKDCKELVEVGSLEVYVEPQAPKEVESPKQVDKKTAPSRKWNKTQLLQYGQSKGMAVEATMTHRELCTVIFGEETESEK